uniref:ribonuclease H n=1 Tax=Anolis carolinensis TaxID=28377 RepID=A0A803TRP3_ANOCA
MSTPGFKKCLSCGSKMPDSDGHNQCLSCLGEAHVAKTCSACLALTPQARKNREMRLKTILYERALFPPPSPAGSQTPQKFKGQRRPLTPSKEASPLPKRAKSSPPATPIPSKALGDGGEARKKKKRSASETRGMAMLPGHSTPCVQATPPPRSTPWSTAVQTPVGLRLLQPLEDFRGSTASNTVPPLQAPVMGAALLPLAETAHPPEAGAQDQPPPPACAVETTGVRGDAAQPMASPSFSQEAIGACSTSASAAPVYSMLTPRDGRLVMSPDLPSGSLRYLSPMPQSAPPFPSPPHRQRYAAAIVQPNTSIPARSDYIHRSPGGRAYFFGPILVQDQQPPQLPLVPMQQQQSTQAPVQPIVNPVPSLPPENLQSQSGSESDTSHHSEAEDEVDLALDQPVPSETAGFVALMSRLHRALNLPVPKTVDCHLFPTDEQQPSAQTASALPAVPYYLDLATAPWVSKPPKPNSVVVNMMQNKRSARTHITPTDKEGRKLEAVGKKVHLGAGISTCMAHYGAYMAVYQDYLWKKITPHLESLPQDKQTLAKIVQQEGVALAKAQKEMAKHSAEAAGRMFAAATVIRRHAWLRTSTLSEEGKVLAEDLPVHDKGLFNPETDTQLKSAQEVRQAANKYGFPTQSTSRYRGKSYMSTSYNRKPYEAPTRPLPQATASTSTKQTSTSWSRGQGKNKSQPRGKRHCLAQFAPAWRAITTDKWVLQIISSGYSIEFFQQPHTGCIKATPPSKVLQEEIRTLLDKGAIVQLHPSMFSQAFFSRYFLVPKKDGGQRPVLDLRGLNNYINPKKFRMVTLSTILPLLPDGAWFASIDLKDAYFHVAIAPQHHRYLAFMVAQKAFCFRVLPFGISIAPRVFTKVMAVVAAHLRLQGITVYPYIDDWLLVARSRQSLLRDLRFTLSLLENLGYDLSEQT